MGGNLIEKLKQHIPGHHGDHREDDHQDSNYSQNQDQGHNHGPGYSQGAGHSQGADYNQGGGYSQSSGYNQGLSHNQPPLHEQWYGQNQSQGHNHGPDYNQDHSNQRPSHNEGSCYNQGPSHTQDPGYNQGGSHMQGPGAGQRKQSDAFRGCSIVHNSERRLHTGGTYPRLCKLSDGSILCGVTQTQNQHRVLTISRSTDNGRSFEPFGEVARSPGDCDNIFLIEIPSQQGHAGQHVSSQQHPMPGGNSTILAAFRNHDLDPQSRKPSHFRITVCRSQDSGRTWKYLAQAFEQSAASSKGMGLWEPFMRIGRHGQIEMTYSAELAPDNQETFRVVSHNGGATWTAPQCLRCHPTNENLRDGMQGIVSTKDRSCGRDALVIVFETTRHRTFSVEYAVSYNEGDTWEKRGCVYCPPKGKNAGAPQIAKYDSHEGFVVIFMCDEDSDKVQWPKKAGVKVCFGDGLRDGNVNWSEPRVVQEEPGHWPGLLQMGPDEVMAVYEHANKPTGKLLQWPRA
ncbi:Sialidase [Pseudomassariella vexata]|uniref:Sialidase n=1 Tax=Pseudomassariella vexata TaxID=1141098 RepID=A0A1Y2D604_9PEZI|nr:Sialidase [Pseudomassariella vexata]ORY54738.1 Sialidase [Pseudomassariella vexata]